MNIKVIVIKKPGFKYLVGFSSDPEAFVVQYLSDRSQYKDLVKESDTHFTFKDQDNKVGHFYATPITDGETCLVSLNDNCRGFNDNH